MLTKPKSVLSRTVVVCEEIVEIMADSQSVFSIPLLARFLKRVDSKHKEDCNFLETLKRPPDPRDIACIETIVQKLPKRAGAGRRLHFREDSPVMYADQYSEMTD